MINIQPSHMYNQYVFQHAQEVHVAFGQLRPGPPPPDLKQQEARAAASSQEAKPQQEKKGGSQAVKAVGHETEGSTEVEGDDGDGLSGSDGKVGSAVASKAKGKGRVREEKDDGATAGARTPDRASGRGAGGSSAVPGPTQSPGSKQAAGPKQATGSKGAQPSGGVMAAADLEKVAAGDLKLPKGARVEADREGQYDLVIYDDDDEIELEDDDDEVRSEIWDI